ncbi:helix-turn-helix domain-containing protein [Neobittarella massiliensis]|uniref:Helix-turn-helix transcriptional regulator n=2 Tax=Oscillospiraceae TaxID=216572 RepID=A0A8J6IPK8_9FIRM|nr:helix-turn-helix transcriptional regulator [Neobittarella massiliensis]MBC3515618.1 helix-turn-helix transcriptional regulator [Neobittarella massiliensis]SCJ51378.1 HTH-type transcriptional regulator immR [uncultured Anaerotruncus sp.]
MNKPLNLSSIGKQIRKYRVQKGWRQDDLAEKADLSHNYISLIERGVKLPALDTFIRIANALEVTADMLLADVLEEHHVKNLVLYDEFETLPDHVKSQIFEVVTALIEHAQKNS